MPIRIALARLSFITGIIVLVTFALDYFKVLGSLATFSWVTLVFFAVVTSISLLLIAMAQRTSSKTSNYVVLGGIGFKFMMSLFFVLIYVLVFKPESPHFVIPFGAYFFIYTIFQVYFMLQLLQAK